MADKGWADVAAAYAATFAPLCAGTIETVLDRVGLSRTTPATRVLDVGTGTGELARASACTGAAVTAVDPDRAMLERAAETAPGVRLCQAALPSLPFPDEAFDVVLANFVVNHLDDPASGTRELARVAAPDGRVAVTIWPSGQNVQSRLWAEVIEASGAQLPPSVRLPADRDFPRTVDGLGALLERAGLRDVVAEPVAWTHRTAPDALWRGAAAGIGGIGRTVVSQPAEVRRRMRAAYVRLVAPLVLDGRLVLETEAVLAVATRR